MRFKFFLIFLLLILLWSSNQYRAPQAAGPGGPFAYISNVNDGTVSVIDISTNTVVNTITVGAVPISVAVDQAGSKVYVTSNSTNAISVIDTSNNAVSSITVGAGPYGVAVNPAGTRVYVTNSSDGSVSVIDTSNNSVIATIPVGQGPRGVAVSANGNFAYVANFADNTVTVINTSSNTVVTTINVGAGPYGITGTPDNSLVYVANNGTSTVSVIDTASNTVTTTINVGNNPIGLAINPAGTRLYVTNDGDNTVSIIDTSNNTVIGSPLTVGLQPDGVTVNPAGTFVYVVNFGDNNLSVIDTATNSVLTTTIAVGSAPSALGSFIGPIGSALQFSLANYTVGEADGNATITVTRSGNTTGSVSVNYATSNGTATAGSDYTAASGTLTFNTGETSKTFTVAITNDTAVEGNETINLALANVSANALLGTQATAVLTIVDNDIPQPGILQFNQATYSCNEAAGSATITVSRSNGSNGTVSVDYQISDGSAVAGNDYNAANGTLIFNEGETSKSFTISIVDDTLIEGNETINLNLANVTGGATIGTQSSAVITIVDNDFAAQLNASTSSVNFGTVTLGGANGSAVVTLSNSGTATLNLTPPFSISGTDADSFSVTSLGSTTVAGGGQTSLSLSFNPTSAGVKNASITITSDANSVVINLTGTAQAFSSLAASTTSVNFGTIMAGSSKSVSIKLTNTGSSSLTMSGPFSLTGDTDQFTVGSAGTMTLSRGASTYLTVIFRPTSSGIKNASLTINSNGGTVVISLTGNGQVMSLSGTSLAFGTVVIGSSKDLTIRVTNRGRVAINLTPPFSIGGNNPDQFQVVSVSSTSIAAGATANIVVRFVPAVSGNVSATLAITSNVESTTLNLGGSGQAVSLNPASVNFGIVRIGSLKVVNVTITNHGNSDITFTSPLRITGTYANQFTVSTLRSATLAAGSSVTVTVTFRPGSTGGKSALLNIITSGGIFNCPLSGTGSL